jgi:uncharacterized protein YoxC
MSIEIYITFLAILIILFLLNMLVKNLQQRVKELEKAVGQKQVYVNGVLKTCYDFSDKTFDNEQTNE